MAPRHRLLIQVWWFSEKAHLLDSFEFGLCFSVQRNMGCGHVLGYCLSYILAASLQPLLSRSLAERGTEQSKLCYGWVIFTRALLKMHPEYRSWD